MDCSIQAQTSSYPGGLQALIKSRFFDGQRANPVMDTLDFHWLWSKGSEFKG